MNVDVVVIGAGTAGLSAAAELRAVGRSCVVLEATQRIGGRAMTAQLSGAPVDLGPSWLHDSENNPLTEIALSHGDPLDRTAIARERRKYVDGRPATSDELADFDRTWNEVSDVASARALADGEPDISFADAIAPMRGRPWTATIEYWESCLIAAADPKRFSVRDWHLNLLEGVNAEVRGGIGAFIARRLGAAAGTIWCDAPATRIVWNGSAGGVRVETPRGTVSAGAAIVTVSTGVLGAGNLAFDPPLPATTRDAIDGLPMGLLMKVCLPAMGGDRLGLPDSLGLQRRIGDAMQPAMNFLCWPFGRPYLMGFFGGPGAWVLAHEGNAAMEAFARAELRSMLGADADRTLGPALISPWAADPAYLGAYAFATVGNASARAALATPLADGHLIFAGEAVLTDGRAGTVGGAWLSGRNAARIASGSLGG
jgi:monoamine oxidase